jgi:hypothetical protein
MTATTVATYTGDVIEVSQAIEGLNSAQLAFGTAGAKTITLSFWVRSSVTGTYSVVLGNSGGGRYYVASYTISAVNTWEKKTITIIGDTSGTWLTTNGMGMKVAFTPRVETASATAAGAWSSTATYGVTGHANAFATVGNIFAITGVQLEANPQATPFEQRPYGTELALCQRYCTRLPAQGNTAAYAIFGTGIGRTGAATIVDFNIPLPTTMRATPTSADVFNVRATDTGAGYTFSTFTLQSTESSPNCVSMSGGGGSGITGYRPYFITSNNNATGGYANFYAEL